MKETFFVAYDPVSRLWDHRPIAPEFPDECWVFNVSARNGHEALQKGFEKYKELTADLSGDQMRVAQTLARQVNRVARQPSDVLMIDIPQHLIRAARTLEQTGFFKIAHSEEALIVLSSAGWKALAQHAEKQRSLDQESDYAQLA